MSLPAFIADLAQIFPKDRLLMHAAALAPYEFDALATFQQRPIAVVIAETQDEVIRTVKVCHAHAVPFVTRGSGTSLSGGSLPVKEGIVIALNKLNRFVKIDIEQRIAVVEPGVINLDITKAVQHSGLLYAPDPSSQPVCTIGGNVAFNSGGAHCLKYGMTSNHVLGLKVVLPDGEVAQFGGESMESVDADWVGMFVGCEGLFGIALEITVRLLPKPEVYKTVLAAYHSLEAAGEAVSMVIASGLLPGAIEIMDALSIQAAEAAMRTGYPLDATALLIVELEGERAQVESEWERLEPLINASNAYSIKVAKNDDERAKIWKGRKSSFSAVGRLSPDYIVQDGVVPRSRLGEALKEIEAISAKYQLRVANVFHAGDGNLHPLILFNAKNGDEFHRAELVSSDIIDLCIRLGGTITGEHGVGVEKRDFMPRQFDEINMDAMWRMRIGIDPKDIANRGKVFPSGEAPALRQVGMHPLEKAGVISRE
jgi:glycolate oxidase